jgi:hypothetical protein
LLKITDFHLIFMISLLLPGPFFINLIGGFVRYLLLLLICMLVSEICIANEVSGVSISSVSAGEASLSSDGAKAQVAKNLANPVANMVSAPFQTNYYHGLGAAKAGTGANLLFQPVAPIDMGGGDLLIVRPILTTSWLRNVDGFTGAGETGPQFEAFYAPYRGSNKVLFGFGPYLAAPSGKSGLFGSQQTGAGVTGVLSIQGEAKSYGFLAFNSWGIGSNTTSGTQNNFYLQPFFSYHPGKGESMSANIQSTYNYDLSKSSNQAIFTYGRVVNIDKQLIQISGGPIYNFNSFPGGPQGWGARLTITFAFLKSH